MIQTRTASTRWFAPETLIQSIGIGLILTVASRAAGLGRGILFARMLDRDQLGTWAITHNTMQMLSVVLVLGIPAGLARYAARFEREGHLRSFLNRAFGAPLAAAAGACALGLLCCRPIARLVYEDANQALMAALLCLGALSLVALNLLQGVMQGLRVYRVNAVVLVAQSVAFAVLAALLFHYWRPDALAGTWAFLLVSATVTAVPIAMLWRHLRHVPSNTSESNDSIMWKPLLVYSLGTWGSSALFSVWSCLDRYMLLHCDTVENSKRLEQIGTYHLVENLTVPLLTLGAGWGIQVLSHVVHLWEAGRRDQVEHTVRLATKVMLYAMTAIAAAIIVFKRPLLAGVFGDTSMAGGEILEFLLVATIWVAAQVMLRCHVLCLERTWIVSVVWVVAVALSFCLNWALIPVLHLQGAAITAMLSTLVSTFLLMWLTQRSGLRLTASVWASMALPGILLLPVYAMLFGLGVVTLAALRTEWLISETDKARIRDALLSRFARRARPAATR